MSLVFSSLFDISCNTLQVLALLEPSKYTSTQQKRIRLNPRLDPSKLNFLVAGFKLLPVVTKELQYFTNGLYAILNHSDFNKAVFEEGIGVTTMLKLLQLLTVDSKFMAIYDKSLQIFEMFIEAVKNDVVWNALYDLQLVMDFILSLNYSSIKATKLGLDCLSVIALHLIVE